MCISDKALNTDIICLLSCTINNSICPLSKHCVSVFLCEVWLTSVANQRERDGISALRGVR